MERDLMTGDRSSGVQEFRGRSQSSSSAFEETEDEDEFEFEDDWRQS
jgi:hypothetical protein